MAAVALVGVATGGGLWAREMAQRREDYLEVAVRREQIRALLARTAEVTRNPAKRRAYAASAAWYEASRDAYARAARMPWINVPHEPPPDLREALARERSR